MIFGFVLALSIPLHSLPDLFGGWWILQLDVSELMMTFICMLLLKVSGQLCCTHNLFISNPLLQYLHVNNIRIMYYMPTPVRDSGCHSSQIWAINLSSLRIQRHSAVVLQTTNQPPWFGHKHSNTSPFNVTCVWKQIQYSFYMCFWWVKIQRPWQISLYIFHNIVFN